MNVYIPNKRLVYYLSFSLDETTTIALIFLLRPKNSNDKSIAVIFVADTYISQATNRKTRSLSRVKADAVLDDKRTVTM